MQTPSRNKLKILNDPVYGFITLRFEILCDLIDHPWFQRLRRISQLGLSHLVYPGAIHNRFHHALGALYLMQHAIDEIRQKGQEITPEEAEAVCIAILLHDIGHGPFSHALEHSIVSDVHHEDISVFIMNRLNEEFDGRLDMAIEIFNDHYPKRFLHQLVSSQLDMDRLDYLRRDSFYSGVAEGHVGSERIIKMLNVADDQLVIEQKGIYSIEKFLVARRLMYWQVYLHKTVLSAEFMLVNILKRAKWLSSNGTDLFATPALKRFLTRKHSKAEFLSDPEVLSAFCSLDDFDLLCSLKVWATHEDKVLSILCKGLADRKLFKVELQNAPFDQAKKEDILLAVQERYDLNREESEFFLIEEQIDNSAYSQDADSIKIMFKDGSVRDIADASDQFDTQSLIKKVEKHFLCYPKYLDQTVIS
jgi:HD superfamily phosphohydrolase